MQYSQEHLKTMVYAKFGGQTECIMGNSKIENTFLCRDSQMFAPIPESCSQNMGLRLLENHSLSSNELD